jgi:hypothetical protein
MKVYVIWKHYLHEGEYRLKCTGIVCRSEIAASFEIEKLLGDPDEVALDEALGCTDVAYTAEVTEVVE